MTRRLLDYVPHDSETQMKLVEELDYLLFIGDIYSRRYQYLVNYFSKYALDPEFKNYCLMLQREM